MVVLQSMSRLVAESIEERMVSEYPAGRKTPQLCRAIRNNDWSMIEHMLEKHPELVFQRKLPGGWLPFHHALKYTHRVGLMQHPPEPPDALRGLQGLSGCTIIQ